MNLHEQLERTARRHERRHVGDRRVLLEIIDDLVEIVTELLEHDHRPPPPPPPEKEIVVQVVMTDSQKVLLHAAEENAAGNPIPRDTATAAWSTDRDDLVTLEPSADGFDCEVVTVGPDGDAIVSVTVTEPSPDGVTAGAQYVGTQGVTINADGTIASVAISAETPEQK